MSNYNKLTPACYDPYSFLREMLKCCVLRCTIYHLFRIQKFIYTRLLIAYFTPLAFKTFAFKDFVIIIKMILLILRIEFYVI